ncbi:MAG: hypothetical protein K2N35_04015, partial [Muribaculaceae bacterium]|nr:hypothetical protein [Muribaculaceae bacterium]
KPFGQKSQATFTGDKPFFSWKSRWEVAICHCALSGLRMDWGWLLMAGREACRSILSPARCGRVWASVHREEVNAKLLDFIWQ